MTQGDTIGSGAEPDCLVGRRQILAASGAMLLSSTTAHAGPYHPAGLYKPQEAAAGLPERVIDAPVGLNEIRVGVTSNPRTWPIINGSVKTRGARLDVATGAPGELFFRQLKGLEFDISEMSTSFLLIANVTGDQRLVPIPVFTSRYFFHSLTLVRRGAGIRRPADLKGKRVGVPEYMMTGALWTRGVFKDEFGVKPEDIEWWVERLPAASQGNVVGKSIPASVRTRQVPADKSVGSMMLSGELDAAVMYIWANKPTPEVRSAINLYDEPSITTLFPDPLAENARYFSKTGIYHINHCAAVKRETLARAPDLGTFAMRLFAASNDLADVQREEANEYYRDTGLVSEAASAHLASRLTPFGFEPNRKTLEALARYSFEQGFVPRQVDMAHFFGATA